MYVCKFDHEVVDSAGYDLNSFMPTDAIVTHSAKHTLFFLR